jgi:2-amino-4-hydroxy-6-hydroxymethyldihydropteridine diphosphokinase
VNALGAIIRIVRASTIHETAAVDAPPGSPPFLNMVVIGYTILAPSELLAQLQIIEHRLGRIRHGVRNEPRTIDLDLILHSAHRVHTRTLTLPHPRAHQREFVMKPLGEISAGFEIARMLRFCG